MDSQTNRDESEQLTSRLKRWALLRIPLVRAGRCPKTACQYTQKWGVENHPVCSECGEPLEEYGTLGGLDYKHA